MTWTQERITEVDQELLVYRETLHETNQNLLEQINNQLKSGAHSLLSPSLQERVEQLSAKISALELERDELLPMQKLVMKCGWDFHDAYKRAHAIHHDTSFMETPYTPSPYINYFVPDENSFIPFSKLEAPTPSDYLRFERKANFERFRFNHWWIELAFAPAINTLFWRMK